MRMISLLPAVLAFLPYASAQAGAWGQCGGFSWTGSDKCIPGVVCNHINPYYSWCVPECQSPAESNTVPAPTATATTSIGPSAMQSALEPQATGAQYHIAALDGWAAGLHVQKYYNNNSAIFQSDGVNIRFMTNGAVRLVYQTWAPNYCIQYLYLNAKAADTSYKPLVLEESGPAADWSFSVNADGILSTPSGLTNFVTCSGDGSWPWALYLQTGSDMPEGNCTTTRLKPEAPPYK